MKKLRWLLCTSVFAVVGCGSAMTLESETTTNESQTSEVSAAGCTTTYGPCNPDYCADYGANDVVQRVSVKCCDGAGTCTTTNYRICGC